ncbi:hypothetical protein MJG53_002264 [Ovis ammon polii x Ovis aries]|uniref:Uncharacterized protein n=1 Tax=Ovis ammon polii x Ovis aries TaxID=2918886 RepID=A0ACB9VMT6_9CETA|nr:hypothetical protein MJG53_002264 [Ovis ammon polii x Ovis aries]
MDMGTQGSGRKRLPNRERLTAEDDALNQIAREDSGSVQTSHPMLRWDCQRVLSEHPAGRLHFQYEEVGSTGCRRPALGLEAIRGPSLGVGLCAESPRNLVPLDPCFPFFRLSAGRSGSSGVRAQAHTHKAAESLLLAQLQSVQRRKKRQAGAGVTL